MTERSRAMDHGPIRAGGRLRGFSLMELLAVTALLAVFAILAIPASQHLLKQSQQAQCIQNLRQVWTASMAYAQDNKMEIPCSYKHPGTGTVWYMALAGRNATSEPGTSATWSIPGSCLIGEQPTRNNRCGK